MAGLGRVAKGRDELAEGVVRVARRREHLGDPAERELVRVRRPPDVVDGDAASTQCSGEADPGHIRRIEAVVDVGAKDVRGDELVDLFGRDVGLAGELGSGQGARRDGHSRMMRVLASGRQRRSRSSNGDRVGEHVLRRGGPLSPPWRPRAPPRPDRSARRGCHRSRPCPGPSPRSRRRRRSGRPQPAGTRTAAGSRARRRVSGAACRRSPR